MWFESRKPVELVEAYTLVVIESKRLGGGQLPFQMPAGAPKYLVHLFTALASAIPKKSEKTQTDIGSSPRIPTFIPATSLLPITEGWRLTLKQGWRR